MYVDYDSFEMPKKHKQQKMTWEQSNKNEQDKRQKEKFKSDRKEKRNAKRDNVQFGDNSRL